MRIVLATMILALGVFCQAFSQELDDNAYVDNFFGTSAVIFSAKQLVNENQWWTDLLPDELVFGSDYVSGLVNAYRITRGEDRLIPPEASVLEPGWEVVVEGGFEYNLDFIGLRPSEVEFVLDALGGIDSFLGNVSVTYRPVTLHYYVVSGESLDSPVEITIGSQVVQIDVTQHINTMLKQLDAVLTQEYGTHEITSIALTYSIYDGFEAVDLSFDVELPVG